MHADAGIAWYLSGRAEKRELINLVQFDCLFDIMFYLTSTKKILEGHLHCTDEETEDPRL